ncbi:MAG: folate family ECF transporter S component [Eubacteriales bacterium]|nr:folate family ECF transporter S component [Eubacteriales bacterium]
MLEQEKNRFISSKNELKSTRTLIVLAMLMALSIIISSFKIRTPAFTISFGPLVKMYAGLLFGPVTGALYGFTLDILQFFIQNTGYGFFPGYTFTETLGVFLYGMFFYKKKFTITRVFVTKFIVVIICNIILGTLWKAMMSGEDIISLFFYYLPVRTVKNLIQWPVDSLIFYMIAEAMIKTGIHNRLRN